MLFYLHFFKHKKEIALQDFAAISFFSLMIEYKPIHQLRSVRLMRLLILVKIGHRQVAFEHNYVQAEMPQ